MAFTHKLVCMLQGVQQRLEWLHQRCPLHDVPVEKPLPVPGLRLPGTHGRPGQPLAVAHPGQHV